MNTILTGISASKGIAIGKAYLFEKTSVEINELQITTDKIESEKEKVREAIKSYDLDLKSQIESNPEIKSVIDAHIELISDPYLIETIESKIENDLNASDLALKNTIDEMVAMMSMLDDDYLKERATDYKDIGEKLMYKLKGIKAKTLSNLKEEVIVIAEELTPSDTSTMKKEFVLGFANDLGGKTSHTSIIAQTLSIPAVVGMKTVTANVKNDDLLILDADNGKLIVNPDEATLNKYKAEKEALDKEKERLSKIKDQPAITKDGRHIEIVCNIGNLEDLDIGLEGGAEGVGLFRTEFLYMESDNFPSEEHQYEVYKKAAKKLGQMPLLIRTLDIGGDKELSYFDFPKEENPFLGWRALRICFDMEEVFKNQLRAILRASAFGNVKILLPMVISVEELKKVNELVKKYKKELDEEGIAYNKDIEIGVMVETPASVFMADELIKYCDYFSIGTNDLTQYLLAVDRGNDKISNLYNNFHPAVLRAIKKVIDASHKAGKLTGMCGGMASDTKATYLLLGLGLDEFSSVGSQIGKIKDIIINSDYKEAQDYATEILKMETVEEIERNLK